ncbi:MAG: hypothetical protein LIR50_22050 [Bacillota bacterium]|nr:hypothetical protein [Bacillota bacterium]
MSRKARVIAAFIISFIPSFFLAGYIRNVMFVNIHWTQDASVWDKFREYYIRTFSANIIPALLIAVIAALITAFLNKEK